jgi:Kef-type K+ transport system membrane component KefB
MRAGAYLLTVTAPEGPAATDVAGIPTDLTYVVLLFALVVLPKALQRYRIPGAITSLLLGIAAGLAGYFGPSDAIQLLSTFGIVSLFLFAGLEIDGKELKRNARILTQHGAVWIALLAVSAFAISNALHVSWRTATLLGLALLTPSTGFILSSLHGFGLDAVERDAVKSKAIAAELISLLALFVVLQSTSVSQMLTATAAMLGIVIFIPLAFRLFAAVVAPYAPRSEFAFLLMVAVVCAYATRRLGVYYLVGAFFVGVAAQRFRAKLPAMSSERMVDALEAFGSVFIPFYFFHAGLHIDTQEIGWGALVAGALMLVIFAPLRIAVTGLHRRVALGEPEAQGKRVGIAMAPTLVFTLVLADILSNRFGAPADLVGGLVLYAIVNTTLPAFLLRSRPPEFERPVVSELPVPPRNSIS